MTLAEAAWHHYAEHAPSSWACPLCPFTSTAPLLPRLRSVMRHAADQHPAYLPERQTVADMLEQLPMLLREAALTVDAPNPDGVRVGGRGAKADQRVLAVANPQPDAERWSPEPKRIRLMRALLPTLDSSLFAPLLECSRLVWEAIDADARRAHPQPIGAPTWATELAWLRKAWPDALAFLDRADLDWITENVQGVWLAVAAMAGVRRRPRNLCPDCKAPLHLGDDDWQTCDAGHQHPGPRRLEREWRRKAPMTTKDICEALRIPEGTVRSWHHRGQITPIRTEGKAHYWLPWDLIALRYPDVVAAIDERDVA